MQPQDRIGYTLNPSRLVLCEVSVHQKTYLTCLYNMLRFCTGHTGIFQEINLYSRDLLKVKRLKIPNCTGSNPMQFYLEVSLLLFSGAYTQESALRNCSSNPDQCGYSLNDVIDVHVIIDFDTLMCLILFGLCPVCPCNWGLVIINRFWLMCISCTKKN